MLLLYQGDTASNMDNNMQGACNNQENTGSSVSGLEVLSDVCIIGISPFVHAKGFF